MGFLTQSFPFHKSFENGISLVLWWEVLFVTSVDTTALPFHLYVLRGFKKKKSNYLGASMPWFCYIGGGLDSGGCSWICVVFKIVIISTCYKIIEKIWKDTL